MNDDAILRELRAAARRADDAKSGTDLDAPLGADFHARVADRIAAERSAAPSARVHRLRAPVALGALAAAAAIALLVARPWSRAPAVADLPAYAIALEGAEDTERGTTNSPPARANVRPDATLTVLLRPSRDVDDRLAVRAFALRGDSAREVHPTVRASSTGSIELRGSARELLGDAAGDVTLVVLVAREGAMPERAVDVARGAEGAPRGVTITRVPFAVR